MDEIVLERSFPAGAVPRLKLSNVRGSVVLHGQAGVEEISVRAAQRPGFGEAEAEVRLEQAPDGEVRAETRTPQSDWPQLREPAAVTYQVRVPAGCAVRLNCVGSQAQVAGLIAGLRAQMVSGALTLIDVQGELELDTVSGVVRGQGLRGALRLSTVSGRVHLAAADLARLSVSTVSGCVELHMPLAGDSIDLTSVSGDIRLCLPAPQGCSVSVRSLSGGLRTALAHTRRGRVVEVGGGGVPIAFRSVSGHLSIELEAGSATGPTGDASRHEVLERVARGELSADDALSAIL